MHRNFYFLICLLTVFSSCRKNKDTDNTQQIYDLLHGRYKIVSSYSTEAVDANLDGVSSAFMNTELPDLQNCDLEITIKKDSYILHQMWPEQFLPYGPEPPGYDPAIGVQFARQGVSRRFTLDSALRKIQVIPDSPMQIPPRVAFPDVVTRPISDHIEMVFTKRLYTSFGWKTVRIITMYERFKE